MKIEIENQRYAFYIAGILALIGIPIAWLAYEITHNELLTIALLVLYPMLLMLIFIYKLEWIE